MMHARIRFVVFLLALVLLASGLGWAPLPASAAGVVGSGTPGSCTDAAFDAALTGGGLVTFNCGAAPFVLAVNTHVIQTGDTTTVDGGGRITLDGGDTLQHFYVLQGANLTLRRIVLANGRFSAGGAVLNQGSLTVWDATLTGNDADSGGSGGAIFNDSSATATIRRSTLELNTANGGGGAIHSLGTLVVIRSTLGNNSAGLDGGAIQNNGGDVTIDLSTLSVNSASNGGGIELNGGTAIVKRSMLIGNVAVNDGGGIRNFSGSLEVENTSFTGDEANRGGGIHSEDATSILNSTLHINHAFLGGAIWRQAGSMEATNSIFSFSLEPGSITPALNCDGFPLLSNGHNISTDASCNLNVAAFDLPSTNPQLGSLANNGGPTQTNAPLPGSPAIDKGTNSVCPTTDQRGIPRPIDGGSGSAICDIGAVEFLAIPEPAFAHAIGSGLVLLAGLSARRRRRSS